MSPQRDYNDDDAALLEACRNGDLETCECLLQRLEHLGRISERPATPPAGAQLLELAIQW